MFLTKKKLMIVLSLVLACVAALLWMVISSHHSNSDSALTDGVPAGSHTPKVSMASFQEEGIQLGMEKNTTYDLHLLMDELPDTEPVYRIHATVVMPAELEVVGFTPNRNNLQSTQATFNQTGGVAELTIRNADDSAIAYANRDASKELATITIRLNNELSKTYQEEIKLSNFEIEYNGNNTAAYDVSGAAAKVNYTQPASAVGKLPPNGNPLVSHKFGADPYALVFGDRVYVYMTNDVLEYDADGNVKDNTYSNINKISVISSDDLVNWTDHGEIPVAGPQGAAKWATQSWAPAAAHKVIDGKDKFFLYFANNASGIGVLTSDSPTGPWVDPIGKALVTRSTPGVEGVTWLFDPAVLVDDDGKAYLYFGGGIPEGKDEMPDTARVMELGPDMTSVLGEAKMIPAPFMFEDAGINKYNGTYYYTYCSNFYGGTRPEGSPPAGEIAYMTSDNPMGPWKYQGTILKNPGHFFGVGGNNHHSMFQFNGEWYIAYHAQTLSKAMGVPKGYRSTQLNKVTFGEDGSIQEIQADYEGVPQIKSFNPYRRVEAATIGWNAGVATEKLAGEGGQQQMVVSDIDDADWIALSKVDFGDKGASTFVASVSGAKDPASIELRLDSPDGKLIGTLSVLPTAEDSWTEFTTKVSGAEGTHHLYFVFRGATGEKLFKLLSWQFGE
ncbi:glycoside hydrolase family 43 protein [Cohnella yongneupensis]|uniref:Glycoside hydrolase family 43 protein n=1 Tax=Cohnella yongneupensis TaxID=425006 RepID=A0ABW0R2M3_9BACL